MGTLRSEPVVVMRTVTVDGRLSRRPSSRDVDPAKTKQAVMKTIEYAQSQMGEQAWNQSMNPEKAVVTYIDNPYKYTEREHDKSAQNESSQESLEQYEHIIFIGSYLYNEIPTIEERML